MKIERGVQADCSELVARLYPVSTDEDLHTLLRELEKITGWTVGIQAGGEFKPDYDDEVEEVKAHLRGEADKKQISRTVKIEETELGRFWEEDNEPVYNSRNLEEPFRSFFLQNSWDPGNPNSRICLLENLYRSEKRITDPYDQLAGLSIAQNDGYCDAPELLLKATQHCYTGHFEPIARACGALNGDYHCHDGGSLDPFETWCRNNGFKDILKT